jgi:hypothetical protein
MIFIPPFSGINIPGIAAEIATFVLPRVVDRSSFTVYELLMLLKVLASPEFTSALCALENLW